MAGKNRTVHILEPFLTDKHGVNKDIGPGFWKELFERVAGLDANERAKIIRDTRHRGAARTNVSPAVNYLYVGKRRPQRDWPDSAKDDGDEVPLELDGDLVEPLYILQVGDTNYAAFMRSTGGPTFSATAEWIQQVAGISSDYEFGLRPYVRNDDLIRLRESAGLVKLDLKFEPGSTMPDPEGGDIMRALNSLQREGGNSVSIAVELSFGNSIPDDGTARSLANQVDKILETGGLSRAKATALKTNVDGTFGKDYLDFIQDRVTYTVEVGRTDSEPQTPDVVLAAMSEGVDRFQRQLSNRPLD
ncbi:hypothetical protein ACIBM3_22950 [Rhodococcus erythropolis]|uniref:hypothetical protein n=1 Tax=Rhodococcus erythropolis TaxID=1833 RepID=UPI00379D9B42